MERNGDIINTFLIYI